MKTSLFLSLAASYFLFSFAGYGQNTDDETAIRQTIQLYFDGIMENDIEKLNQAFHPDAHVMHVNEKSRYPYRGPTFSSWAQFVNLKTDYGDLSKYHNKIVSIDTYKNSAMVKTDLDWPEVRYIDYLSLLKISGEWRIVNKIWDSEEK